MRLSRSTGTGEDVVTYTYVYTDGLLSRMTKGDITLYFTYDAAGTPLTVSIHTGTYCRIKRDSICGTDCKTYYYVTNLQGDVIAILDETGNEVAEYSYDAWGRLLCDFDEDEETIYSLNPLFYRGYVYDRETGLYYLQSRYYDPEIGRFISADSLLSTGQGVLGNNMFAYCNNNPVMYQDPSGHLAITTTIVVSCLIAFAVGAGTSAVSQGLQYGWEEISFGQVLVDGALAAASVGLAATGIPLAASIGLGAAMGFGQYAAACGFHNESMTVEDAITATVLGGIGGAISGAGAKNLKTLANIYDGMIGRAATGFKALITTAQKYGFGSKQLSLVNNLYGKAIQTAVNQGIQKAFIGSSIKIVSTTIATPLVSAFVTPGVKTVSDWIGGLVIGV